MQVDAMEPDSKMKLGFCGSETLRDIAPVDNIENGLNIVGTNVFVLEIVCVLPHVDTEKWNQTFRHTHTRAFIERLTINGSILNVPVVACSGS